MSKSHKSMSGNCSDHGQEKKKTIDEILNDIAELAAYEDKLRDSERSRRHPVFCFKNPQSILDYFAKVAESGMFEPKIDIPPNIANAKEMFGYLSENCSVGETLSVIGRHAEENDAYLRSFSEYPKKEDLPPPNKTAFIFRETVHICDPHGDLQSVVDAVKEFCDEDGCLKKDIVILCHGDYVDRGKKSVETLLFFLKLKEAYGDQVQMLQGNHEDASVFASSGHGDWLRSFGESNRFTFALRFNEFFERMQMPCSALVMPVDSDGKMISCSLAVHAGPLFFQEDYEPSMSEILANPRLWEISNSNLWNAPVGVEWPKVRYIRYQDLDWMSQAMMPVGEKNTSRGCGIILGERKVELLKQRGIHSCVLGHVHKTLQQVRGFYYSSMVSGNISPDACESYAGMRTIVVTQKNGEQVLMGLRPDDYVERQLVGLQNQGFGGGGFIGNHGQVELWLHAYATSEGYQYRCALFKKAENFKCILLRLDQKFAEGFIRAVSLDNVEELIELLSIVDKDKATEIAKILAEECRINIESYNLEADNSFVPRM